jgi:hypothetical protein
MTVPVFALSNPLDASVWNSGTYWCSECGYRWASNDGLCVLCRAKSSHPVGLPETATRIFSMGLGDAIHRLRRGENRAHYVLRDDQVRRVEFFDNPARWTLKP